MDARTGCVKSEFANGDGHATRPLIADAENRFSIGYDQEPNFSIASGTAENFLRLPA